MKKNKKARITKAKIDLQQTENDASTFQFGYINSDCNGDGGSDIFDLQLIENNNGLFIYYARPY